MLIPLSFIQSKYNPKFTGVIHCGAHYAEEHDDYLKAGIKDMIYIEPCLEAFEVLLKKFGNNENVSLYNVACSDHAGQAMMFTSRSNEGQSNSLLEPLKHLEQHPNVVFDGEEEVILMRLDDIDFDRKKFNFLSCDCQGSEGLVLKGAEETLKSIDFLYLEVNRGETYRGNALLEDIQKMLPEFTMVELKWASANLTWGDAFFVRKTLLETVKDFTPDTIQTSATNLQ